MKYLCEIVNVGSDRLNTRSGAGTQHQITGKLVAGDRIIVVDRKTVGNETWDLTDAGFWVCNTYKNGANYVRTLQSLDEDSPKAEPVTKEELVGPSNDPKDIASAFEKMSENVAKAKAKQEEQDQKNEENKQKNEDGLPVTYNIPDEKTSKEKEKDYESLFIKVNPYNFPKYLYTNNETGERVYDWYMPTSTLQKEYQIVKRNLNIPSAFNQNEIQKNMYSKFSRFKLTYPDIELKNTIPYVVFTRPDVNLVDISGNLIEQGKNNPKIYGIYQSNRDIIRCLSKDYSGSHMFNPVLSNRILSLEIGDESLDTLETAETFSGYKVIYSKTNIKSVSAGTISIRFRELVDLGITKQIQAWVEYENGVYRGTLMPKEEYIFGKEIDYACNLYYFLLDSDFETIKFWSKYYGIFPVSVNKSVFSYDAGSHVQLPEINISFGYIYKDDLNPLIMTEFNDNSKGSYIYTPTFVPALGHGGKDWVGAPYIESYRVITAINGGEEGFKLRFRPSN